MIPFKPKAIARKTHPSTTSTDPKPLSMLGRQPSKGRRRRFDPVSGRHIINNLAATMDLVLEARKTGSKLLRPTA